MITVIGLGPSDRRFISLSAWEKLHQSKNVYLRTSKHPIVDELDIEFSSFDEVYDRSENFEEVYSTIVETLIEKSKDEDLVYAVPGNPYVAETTVHKLIDSGVDFEIIPSSSFIDVAISSLKLEPSEGLNILDALEDKYIDPKNNSLIMQVYSRKIASDLKIRLMDSFSDEHQIIVLHNLSSKDEEIYNVNLYELDRLENYDHLLSIYVPKREDPKDFYSLNELVKFLISSEGCPWDNSQDHRSLRRYLLEESYELIHAIEQEDDYMLEEELGDLIFQVLFHASYATKRGVFTIHNVLETLKDKLIRRHTHVFSTDKANSLEEVEEIWQKNKNMEVSLTDKLMQVPKSEILLYIMEARKYLDKLSKDWKKNLSEEEVSFLNNYGYNYDFYINLREKIEKVIKNMR